ncbi:MAG: dihydrodipicolinate synthase family protein [Acidobacteria bacterium]|nr:dihydrodipicolinate synthase family protein [Acidobacteriota bacterium]
MNRRKFLSTMGTGVLGNAIYPATAKAGPATSTPSTGLANQLKLSSQIHDRTSVAEFLNGPIQSFRTSFNEDGTIDYDGVRNFVDRSISGGSKTILLTAGDSHLTCMTNEEIATLTRAVCEHTAGRAMVVAADRNSRTASSLQFAEYAKSVGASVLMCQPPTWATVSAKSLADHYVAISQNILVMIVTNVFSSNHTMGIEAVKTAVRASPKVVAIKDDVLGDLGSGICKVVNGTGAILFAGGRMKNHLWLWQQGCGQTFMATFLAFAPAIEKHYWTRLQNGDAIGAQALIEQYENPFFDYLLALPCGWNAGMHAILSIHGITKKWLPRPYLSASDETVAQLKDYLRQHGML